MGIIETLGKRIFGDEESNFRKFLKYVTGCEGEREIIKPKKPC